jgi:arylsulfate sulfotransferase
MKKEYKPQSPEKNRRHLRWTLILAGFVVLLLTILLLIILFNPAYSTPAETTTFAKEITERQEKVEAGLRAYYKAREYPFENPMVVQNPYQTTPLTALVIFDTLEESQVSIHVPGKTPEADVDYTFPGYRKHHEVPVYGLYAETLNHVKLSLVGESGDRAEKVIDLQTEPLPVYRQHLRVDTVDAAKYSPGFNFLFSDYKPVFDINGGIRWYSTQATYRVFTKLNNGRYLYTLDGHNLKLILEMDLLGKVYSIYNVPGGIHHEIIELPNGNLLVTSSDPKSDTMEDIIIEVNRNNGHFSRYYDLKRIFDATRKPVIGMSAYDWAHVNSLTYDVSDNTVIISSRNQSDVFKLTYPGMQIKWILGPHDNWGARFDSFLLEPKGESFEWSWAQHHATLYQPDIAGDGVVDILLYDNGPFRSFELSTATSPLEWYSRVVHYRVDENAGTVEQVWEYGKERGADIFSSFLGSANTLENGDVLGTWGAIAKDSQGVPLPIIKDTDTNVSYESKLIEINPFTDEVVFEATSIGISAGYAEKNVFIYRASRAGFYDNYSEAVSSLRTPVKDTSKFDLFDRAQMAWLDAKRWSNTVPFLLESKRFLRKLFKGSN